MSIIAQYKEMIVPADAVGLLNHWLLETKRSSNSACDCPNNCTRRMSVSSAQSESDFSSAGRTVLTEIRSCLSAN